MVHIVVEQTDNLGQITYIIYQGDVIASHRSDHDQSEFIGKILEKLGFSCKYSQIDTTNYLSQDLAEDLLTKLILETKNEKEN